MRPENNQKIDQWLETGLKHYANSEPRSGLEARLLAVVRAKEQRSRIWQWRWRPSLVIAAMVIGAVVFLSRPSLLHVHRHTATSPSAIRGTASAELLSAPPVPRKLDSTPSPRRRSRRLRSVLANRVEGSADTPRLEQFPSPQPLNEQEEMLARYVRERRQEAVVVARARAELRKQELARFSEELPQAERLEDLQQ
jgi:hypothetical protein